MENMTYFNFSETCYFDMQTNRLIDMQNNKILSITGQQRTVLRKLIEEYPRAVDATTLGDEARCSDESRLRKVIKLLRDRHELIKECLQNNRGEYLLVKSRILETQNSQEQPLGQSMPCSLQDMNILIKPHFVEEARKDTFDALDDAFQKSRIAFLVGCGGIGKSEACKHWAIKKKRGGIYDTVVFAQLNSEEENSNVLSLITDDSIFVLTEGFDCRYERESDVAYFTRKLNKIRRITNERTLIILDNYDQEDPHLEELLHGTYHLLVTTRNKPEDFAIPIIPVEEIQDIDHLKKIFFGYLGGVRSDIRKDDPYIEKLFGLVSNHTLAIEIIAKSLRFSDDTPKNLYQMMSSSEDHTLIRNVDGTINHRTPFEIIQMLFSLSHLKKDKNYSCISQVLAFMAAMPTKGIEQELFDKWSIGEIRKARYILIQKSWLREDCVNGVRFISMHPLIREVVWHELRPTLDSFSAIVSKFVRDDSTYIDGLYHKPKETKDQYEGIALSMLAAFPVQDINHFDFYIKLLRILRICANSIASLNLAENLKKLLEASGQANTWRYGLINYQVGMVYASLLRQRDKGVEFYEAAINIMEITSQTDEEKMWLAFLYRDIASTNCQDRYLFATQGSDYINTIEMYLRKGEELVASLLVHGFTAKNLEIYRSTLNVWRSKIEISRGNYKLAAGMLDDAEREFERFGYANVVDKAAVADVRALICSKNGQYKEEIDYLMEANEAFSSGFSEYHYAAVERLLKLATAYKNNGQLINSMNVATRCKHILKDMMENNEELSNEILPYETNRLLVQISQSSDIPTCV